jgi:hypothetical protein
MSLDLNKLSNKLDEALIKETTETLSKFLNDKRMENNKQQTAVEWLEQEMLKPNLSMKEILEQAKEMEKQKMIQLVQGLKDYTHESHTILGYDEREASEFVDIFYNKTYGGNK